MSYHDAYYKDKGNGKSKFVPVLNKVPRHEDVSIA